MLLVGSPGVGKKSVRNRAAFGKVIEDYIPGMVDYSREVTLPNGSNVRIEFMELPCSFEALMEGMCKGATVVVICFSQVDPDTYRAVTDKWLPEIKKYVSEELPIVYLGTKGDLRGDESTLAHLAEKNQQPVSELDVELLCGHRGIAFACSARTGEGIDEFVMGVAKLAAGQKEDIRKDKKCIIA